MFTFETADQKEVRRFRIAQFNGRTATVKSGGSMVTGHVRSVLESKSSIPQRWTITLIPSPPKPNVSARPRLACIHSSKIYTEPARFLRAPRDAGRIVLSGRARAPPLMRHGYRRVKNASEQD